MRFEGKVALVTGGASQVGRALSLALAQEGADLVVWDVDPAREETCAQAENMGRRTLSFPVDVSDWDQVSAAAEAALARFGRVDILVNNAGICQTATIEEITPQEWDRVLDVNLKGVFLCSKAFMPAFKEQRQGKIVNMSSIAGKVGGIAVGANYSASKAGVICFTKSLAKELAPYGVNVNAVAPGVIDNPMGWGLRGGLEAMLPLIPLGRVATNQDIVQAVLFLASAQADFITGELLDVNGGQVMD